MTLTRSAGILAFYGIMAFLSKSRIGNQIQFFRFYLILSDFFQFLDFSRLLDFPIPQLQKEPICSQRENFNQEMIRLDSCLFCIE